MPEPTLRAMLQANQAAAEAGFPDFYSEADLKRAGLPRVTIGPAPAPAPTPSAGTESQDIINNILQAGQPFPSALLGQPFFEGDPGAVGLRDTPTGAEAFGSDGQTLGEDDEPAPGSKGAMTKRMRGGGAASFEGVTRVAPGLFMRQDGSFFVMVGEQQVEVDADRAQSIVDAMDRSLAPPSAGPSPSTLLGQQRLAFDQAQAQQRDITNRRSFLAQLASDPGAFLQLAIETGRAPTVPGALAPLFPQLAGGGQLMGGEPIPGFAEFLAQRQAAIQGQQIPGAAPPVSSDPFSPFGMEQAELFGRGTGEITQTPPPTPGLAPQPGTAAFAREQEELFGRGTGNIIGGVTRGTSAQTLGGPFAAPTEAFPGRQFIPTAGGLNFPGFGTGAFDFSQQGVTRPFGVSPEQFAAEEAGLPFTTGTAAQTAAPTAPQQAQAPLSGFLPTLTSPSAQFFAGLNPTSRSQFGALERGRTGESFQDIAFRLAQRRPPGGGGGGFSRVR